MSFLSWLKNIFAKKENKAVLPTEEYKGPKALPPEIDHAYEKQLRAYRIAQKELNVREVDGEKNNPRIVEYHASTYGKFSSDEIPWCSSFINWCMDQAQLPKTNDALARSWLNWGQVILDPKEGDTVILSRGKDMGHVGFVHKVNALTVSVLGGNQKQAVCIQEYPRYRVLGYRRVL